MFNADQILNDHLQVMTELRALLPAVTQASELMIQALQSGQRVFLCGNGGSAADAQHIAAEIIGRFETERIALPAVALTTDSSILTAVGNDYGYEQIFSRQVEGLASLGDILIAYSTSGNSDNVINATNVALAKNCKVIALTGKGGGKLGELATINLCVPSSTTARIQEAHGFIGHVLCAAIDQVEWC